MPRNNSSLDISAVNLSAIIESGGLRLAAGREQ
jgi:hypothetical protein